MADFGIRPEIALQAAGPKRTNIADLLGTATKAMEYSRLSELYPQIIRQTTAEAGTAETTEQATRMDFNRKMAANIASGQVSMMFDPNVVAARDGKPFDRQALINSVEENAKLQTSNAGLDWETQGKKLSSPYMERAVNAPETLSKFYKERMLVGLDDVTRATMTTPVQVQGYKAPTSIIPIEGVARPIRMEQGAQEPPLQPVVGVSSAAMTAPTAGYQLPFPIRPAGVADIRPDTPDEDAAKQYGTIYLNTTQSAQSAVPSALRSVSQVINGAQTIGNKINFETGAPADIERAFRVFFGDDMYQQLNKDLANAQIARMKASGGDLSTDAGKSLAAAAGGTATLSPRVLIKIAGELTGELTRANMESKGAQKAATLFGNANLRAYQQAFNENSQDMRVFEAIYIGENVANIKNKTEALTKIIPTSTEELELFRKRIKNITKLSETGTLK